MAEHITFIRGKVEEVQLPCMVDIIISEWMGYFLLYEGMLDSVLVARDQWLKKDGIMAPSCTKILISAFGDAEWYNDTVNFWNDVYGFSMKPMATNVKKDGVIQVVDGKQLISDSIVIKSIDTRTTASKHLDFLESFKLQIIADGKVYAFCGWFDTYFDGPQIDPVSFSTSPVTKATHWMQTLFILEEPCTVHVGDSIHGSFGCKKSAKNPRELDVVIEYRVNDGPLITQSFNVV